MAEISTLKFNEGAPTILKSKKYGTNWPVVYIINNNEEAYVGETTDASMRSNQHLANEVRRNLTKINIIGDTTVLSEKLQNYIEKAKEKSKNNTGLQLNIAFNYGGRAEIVRAIKIIASDIKNGVLSVEDINEELVSNNLYTKNMPDPDLLIRTSGEIRTSNFLPWQIVYSEFYFPEKHWPEFTEDDFIEAIKVYQQRNRRFGGNK